MKNIVITIMVAVISLMGLSSCVQKFPKPSLAKEGVLIIPHQASDITGEQAFGYNYKLGYRPETPVIINITPSVSKQFFIVPNFPAGKYELTYIEIVGTQKGRVRGKTGSKMAALFGDYPFEIKPGEVTILDHIFKVWKSGDVMKWSQYRILEPLHTEDKENIIQTLKQVKNADQWRMPVSEKSIRFEERNSGIVYDRDTGLEWYKGPDKDINWYEAKAWAENLPLDGGAWKLPSINELKQLYHNYIKKRRDTPLLLSESSWVWSDSFPNSNAKSFPAGMTLFSKGRVICLINDPNYSSMGRVYAVRLRKPSP